jgi:hypothetical protein
LDSQVLDAFESETQSSPTKAVLVNPLSAKNAANLRRHLE